MIVVGVQVPLRAATVKLAVQGAVERHQPARRRKSINVLRQYRDQPHTEEFCPRIYAIAADIAGDWADLGGGSRRADCSLFSG
jgi:hypothetical protein